jgi:hypothetical protein
MLRKTLLLGLLGAAALTAQAAATPAGNVHVTGRFELVKVTAPDCTKTAGKAWLLHCTAHGYTLTYKGALKGSSVTTFTQTLDCKNGAAWGGGTETFTGSVAGVGSGTLTWNLHFASGFDCASNGLHSFSATDVVVSGTGALAGLHGSFYRIANNTYSGDLA